jgi:hypothetical protein
MAGGDANGHVPAKRAHRHPCVGNTLRAVRAPWSSGDRQAMEVNSSWISRKSMKADSTLRTSRAVPHPSTDRALCRLPSEVERDPVHSTRYGRQRKHVQSCKDPPKIEFFFLAAPPCSRPLVAAPRRDNGPRGVTVSALDSESSDRGSNPREAFPGRDKCGRPHLAHNFQAKKLEMAARPPKNACRATLGPAFPSRLWELLAAGGVLADGQTVSSAPDLLRPPKLGGTGPGQCRVGGPPGKSSGCCQPSWISRGFGCCRLSLVA